MLAVLLWLALCAYLNVWRGHGGFDGFDWPSNLQRGIVSLVLAAPAMVASPIHGAIIWVLVWVFGFMFGWGGYFDFGRGREGDHKWINKLVSGFSNEATRDYVGLSIRGLFFTVPTAIVAATVSPVALILAPFGALMGPAYALSMKAYRIGKRQGDYIALGEAVWGGILGAIFFDMGLLIGLG